MRYTDPLNEQTFYAIFVEWRGEIRPFTVEQPMLETEDEVIAALKEHPNAIAVYRVDHDMPCRAATCPKTSRAVGGCRYNRSSSRTTTICRSSLGYLTDDEMFGCGRIAA